MRNGAHITVVRGDKTVHAHALKLLDGWWWVAATDRDSHGVKDSGPLGEEHSHYVRGFLRTWWPPHRKRAAALLVSYALGPAMPPSEPTLSVRTAKKLMDAMMRGLRTDVQKLIGDARRISERAEYRSVGRRIKPLTRRWP
jgi:hypothetical protein